MNELNVRVAKLLNLAGSTTSQHEKANAYNRAHEAIVKGDFATWGLFLKSKSERSDSDCLKIMKFQLDIMNLERANSRIADELKTEKLISHDLRQENRLLENDVKALQRRLDEINAPSNSVPNNVVDFKPKTEFHTKQSAKGEYFSKLVAMAPAIYKDDAGQGIWLEFKGRNKGILFSKLETQPEFEKATEIIKEMYESRAKWYKYCRPSGTHSNTDHTTSKAGAVS